MTDAVTLLATAFGTWSPTQEEGFQRIIAAASGVPLTHRAYQCATAYHETGKTMQPVCEMGAVKYFDKYEPTTRLGRALGNTVKGDGYRYRGRGFAQITGRRNYRIIGKKLGYDLEANPSKALDPDVAAKILVMGTAQGWFTGRKLADYGSDYLAMRRTVNGTDKAATIAAYARKFDAVLRTIKPPVGKALLAPRVKPKVNWLTALLLSMFSRP